LSDSEREMLAVWMRAVDGRLLAIENRLNSVISCSASTSGRLTGWVSAVALLLSAVAVASRFL